MGNIFLHTYAMDMRQEQQEVNCHPTQDTSNTTNDCFEKCFGFYDDLSSSNISLKKILVNDAFVFIHQYSKIIEDDLYKCLNYKHIIED
jgi:hypothetical protein